jgi:hypothetical protein
MKITQSKSGKLYMKLRAAILINDERVNEGTKVKVEARMKLHFECEKCPVPHIFMLNRDVPQKRTLNFRPLRDHFNQRPRVKLAMYQKLCSDVSILTNHEEVFTHSHREALKRAMLLFGITRVDKMRDSSDLLSRIPTKQIEEQVRIFLKMMHTQLYQPEHDEIRQFIEPMLTAPEGQKDYTYDPEDIDMKSWGGEARIHS